MLWRTLSLPSNILLFSAADAGCGSLLSLCVPHMVSTGLKSCGSAESHVLSACLPLIQIPSKLLHAPAQFGMCAANLQKEGLRGWRA